MLLDELKSIWGIPTDTLKAYNKKYLRSVFISYIIDIIVFSIILIMMVKQQVSAESYYICCLVVCFTFTLYSSVLIDKDKAEACRLCRKFKKAKVEEAYYKVDAKKLYSVLYCSGCKRVKEDKDLSYYFELIISQCLTDLRYCRVIMKYLSRYEVDEESEDTICFYVVKQNKKTYFISFKEDSINE